MNEQPPRWTSTGDERFVTWVGASLLLAAVIGYFVHQPAITIVPVGFVGLALVLVTLLTLSQVVDWLRNLEISSEPVTTKLTFADAIRLAEQQSKTGMMPAREVLEKLSKGRLPPRESPGRNQRYPNRRSAIPESQKW